MTASQLVDLVKVSLSSSGTGVFVLGSAIPSFRGVEALTNGQQYSYTIQNGSDYEYGTGTFLSSGSQLTRSPISSSNGNAPLDLPENTAISFVVLAEDLYGPSYAAAAQAAAVQTASDRAQCDADAVQTSTDRAAVEAAAGQAADGQAVYSNAYASALPSGVTALSSAGVGTGSGGTAGTYSGGVSGGPAGFAWTYTIGSDGKIASYAVTNPGLASTTTAPTLSYPSGSVTGATAPVATVGSLIADQGTYWAVSSDSLHLTLYRNNGGAVAFVAAPNGDPVQVATGTLIDQQVAAYSFLDTWYVGQKQAMFLDSYADGTVSTTELADGSKLQYDSSATALPISVGDTWYVGQKQAISSTLFADGTISSAEMIDGDSYPETATNSDVPPIFILGDSLSTNTGGQTPYYQQIATATGRSVLASGQIVGGQTSRQQVIWAGMKAIPCTVSGNQITSGSNQITQLGEYAISGMSGAGYHVDNYQWLSTPADLVTRTSRAQIGSTTGTVTRTASSTTSETYSFVPDSGQSLPVTCPPGTPLVVIPPVDLSEATIIFRTGRNDYNMSSIVLDSLDCAITYATHGRIMVCSITNGEYQGERWSSSSPGSGWSSIFALEQDFAERWPRIYQPTRRLLIDKALAALSITPTTMDLYDQSTDVVPWSLHFISGTGTLNAAIGAADTTFSVTGTGYALDSATVLRIDSEWILVTGVSGSWTVTSCVRGFGGSTAASHASGAAYETRDRIHRTSASYGFEANQDAALLAAQGI